MSKTIYSGPHSIGSDHFDNMIGTRITGCLVLLVGIFICILGQPIIMGTTLEMSGGDITKSIEIWLGWMIASVILAAIGGFIAMIIFTKLSPGKKR